MGGGVLISILQIELNSQLKIKFLSLLAPVSTISVYLMHDKSSVHRNACKCSQRPSNRLKVSDCLNGTGQIHLKLFSGIFMELPSVRIMSSTFQMLNEN